MSPRGSRFRFYRFVNILIGFTGILSLAQVYRSTNSWTISTQLKISDYEESGIDSILLTKKELSNGPDSYLDVTRTATINVTKPSQPETYVRNNFTTNFKFFIYDLPKEFNKGVLECHAKRERITKCMTLSHYGMGPELYRGNGISVRDSHQFSLEVVMHNKLLLSSKRTLNPDEADMFYIPAYIGLLCLCHYDGQIVKNYVDRLISFLQKMPYYNPRSSKFKPHFAAVGKIQYEMGTINCPYLSKNYKHNITFLGIERESRPNFQHLHRYNRFIGVPYPSYVHYLSCERQKVQTTEQRDVFIFYAASTRKSTTYRIKLLSEFTQKTNLYYHDYKRSTPNASLDMVMLKTFECRGEHRNATIPWMQHSIFCLQPGGDSPTRKSFFDAVLSGCIPVLFPHIDETIIPYPFQNYIKYYDFTVTVPYERRQKEHVLSILREITPTAIQSLQRNLTSVAHWFQYSLPYNNSSQCETDALELIFKELADMNKT